ncbi:hypothetical protein TNCT_333301, partial [Trichonephila clavata]
MAQQAFEIILINEAILFGELLQDKCFALTLQNLACMNKGHDLDVQKAEGVVDVVVKCQGAKGFEHLSNIWI